MQCEEELSRVWQLQCHRARPRAQGVHPHNTMVTAAQRNLQHMYHGCQATASSAFPQNPRPPVPPPQRSTRVQPLRPTLLPRPLQASPFTQRSSHAHSRPAPSPNPPPTPNPGQPPPAGSSRSQQPRLPARPAHAPPSSPPTPPTPVPHPRPPRPRPSLIPARVLTMCPSRTLASRRKCSTSAW